jgi:hypothetical protein
MSNVSEPSRKWSCLKWCCGGSDIRLPYQALLKSQIHEQNKWLLLFKVTKFWVVCSGVEVDWNIVSEISQCKWRTLNKIFVLRFQWSQNNIKTIFLYFLIIKIVLLAGYSGSSLLSYLLGRQRSGGWQFKACLSKKLAKPHPYKKIVCVGTGL